MEFTFVYPLTVLFSTIVCYLLYKIVRPKFPIKVNCWFCAQDSIVPYGNKNCWDCPQCTQYNGFSEDGDYNKPIPSQYKEELNYPIGCKPQDFLTTSGLFCDECSRNQLLKVKQLAAFEPLVEANYDAEVEHYEKQLEETYRLCPYCSFRVSDELSRKNAVLESKTQYQEMKESILNNSISSNKSLNNSSFLINNEERKQLWIHVPASILLVLCCIVLSFSSVYKMLEHDVMSCEHYFPADFIDGIEVFENYAAMTMYAAIIACLLVKFSYGRGKLFVIDAVHIYMFLMLIIVWNMPINKWLTDSDDAVINILLTSGTTALTFYSFTVPRTTKPKYSIKRFSMNNSYNSGESVNSSPLSSVSTSKKTLHNEDMIEVDKYDQVNQQNDDLNLFFDSFSIGSSLNRKKISIGSSLNRKKYDSGIFGSSNSIFSSTTQNTRSFDFQRPLISPAKFKFQRQSSQCGLPQRSYKNPAFSRASSVASYNGFVNPFMRRSFQRCSSSARLNSTLQSHRPSSSINPGIQTKPLFQTLNRTNKFQLDQSNLINTSACEKTLLQSPSVPAFSSYRNSHLRHRDVAADGSEDREPSSTSDPLNNSHLNGSVRAESNSIWRMPFVVGFLMGASIVCNGLLVFVYMRS